MKYLLVILTISCILAKDVYQFSWDVWFSIHQKEVAEKLCENKANPLLNCNGHCYLSKQLKKATVELEQDLQNTGSNRPKVSNEVKIIDFKQLEYSFEKFKLDYSNEKLVNYFTKDWKYIYTSDIEHPPTIG